MSTITRITIAEYDRMIAAGHFEGEPVRPRLELIEGELCPMSPIGPIHDWLGERLTRWSYEKTSQELVAIRIQGCLAIHESGSVPEPDVMWIQQGDYRTQRPTSHDALLIIEIADSSLDYDCGEKASLYAAGGVADYWVVNVPGERVEVFREPVGGEYKLRQVFRSGDTIRPLAFPEISLAVAALFPANP